MFLTLDRRLAGDKGAFFVQARAEELAPLGCMEGDYILLEPASIGDLTEGCHRGSQGGRAGRVLPVLPERQDGVAPTPRGKELAPRRWTTPDPLVLLGRVTGMYRRMDHLPGPPSRTHRRTAPTIRDLGLRDPLLVFLPFSVRGLRAPVRDFRP